MSYSIFEETMVTLPWTEVEKSINDGAIILLPTGVIEAHGPHLSLEVDIYGSYIQCKLSKRLLEAEGIKTLIAPPLYWGINHVTSAFPGSFTLRESTMKALIIDTLASLHNWGVTNAFIINHHGDYQHWAALLEAAKEARSEMGLEVKVIVSHFDAGRFNITEEDSHTLVMKAPLANENGDAKPQFIDIHAGRVETSMMAKHFPGELDVDIARKLSPTNYTMEDMKEWRKGGEHCRKKTPLCYLGSPAEFHSDYDYSEREARLIAETIGEFLKNQGER